MGKEGREEGRPIESSRSLLVRGTCDRAYAPARFLPAAPRPPPNGDGACWYWPATPGRPALAGRTGG
jgi:hypothetical protein